MLLAPLALASLIVIAAGEAEPEAAHPLELRALEQAVAGWVRDISFCCNYRVRSGPAVSLDSALRGEFDESQKERSSMLFSGGGILCKDGKKVRLSMHYDGGWLEVTAPAEVEGVGPGNWGANFSFDEMTDDVIQVQYDPPEPGAGGSISFERRRVGFAGTAGVGPNSLLFPTPLAPAMGYGKPALSFEPVSLLGKPPLPWKQKAEIAQADAEHLEVTIIARNAERGEVQRRVTFWTKPSPPVITRIEESGRSATRRYASTYVTLSDFVECPGGSVPRRVVHVYQHPAPGAILLKVWESNDLGLRACEPDDFSIKVEPTTTFGGLSHPVRFKRPLYVGLSELSAADVGNKVYRAAEVFDLPAVEGGAAPRARPAERWLVLAAVVAAVLAVALGAWGRRPSRTRGGAAGSDEARGVEE